MLRRLRIENLVLIRATELELSQGLNVVTGETGAGKTIFAQAIGLLLGAKGDAGFVGPAASEAYVEAELDVPDGFFDDDELAALAEQRPEDEAGIVLARRVFGDGRSRAYAWGRAVAREDLAATAERLVSMSGQFEQRRLARPAYQLDVLDSFCGPEQAERRQAARAAWRELVSARRRHAEISHDADAAATQVAELRILVADTEGLLAGEEDELRAERERIRRVGELGAAATAAVRAVAPEDGEGAATLAAAAEAVLAPLAGIAPELEQCGTELRDLAVRLHEVGSELHRFLSMLDMDSDRLDIVEERLDAYARARRRFAAQTTEELLGRRDSALAELEALTRDLDPVAAADAALAEAEHRVATETAALRQARQAACGALAEAVAGELRGVGMGEGEFQVILSERERGPSGADQATFLIRPNPGLPFAPVAESASGGELSRVALAIAAVAGGRTLVFDEIDAGIGGVTAHLVADTLVRLAEHAQVIAITHLPQIASAAERHFRVEKVPGDPTHTRIELLGDGQRKAELERMLGGEEFLATVTGDRGQ